MADVQKRPVGDFFGPFFKVKFYNPNAQPVPSPTSPLDVSAIGQAVKISADNFAKQQEIDSRGISNYAANLVIQAHPGVALMTLTLTPPYNEALSLLESGIFQYGGVVGVKWGYEAGNLITKEYPFIINQPKVQFGRDITITISGVDAFSHVLKHRVANAKYSRKQYVRDFTLLTYIATQLNYNIAIDELSVSELTGNPNHPVNTPKTTPFPQADSDWELFKTVCRGDNIVWHFGPGRNITLYDRKKITSKPIDYDFFWYDVPSSNRDIPMSNFTTNPLPTIFAPKAFRSQLHTSHDLDTGQTKYEIFDTSQDPNTSHSGDPTTDKTVAGTNDVYGQTILLEDGPIKLPPYKSALLKEQIQVGMRASHPPNTNSGLDKLRNEGRDASLVANATATLTAPGHPDVMPPMNISVRGVGIFDGAYYIISAKHSVGTSGYDMTLDLLKTTSDTGNRAANTKEPPGEEDQLPPNDARDPNNTGRQV